MLTIYTKTYSLNETCLENSNRITIPVNYLKESGVKIFSSEYINTISEHNILLKYNSQEYINMFNLSGVETACNFCSCMNSLETTYCYMCANKFNKDMRVYLNNDNDTLITTYTMNELEEVSKVLTFLVEKFLMYSHAYILLRPPGHHAYTNHHEGFCIVNNAYILASELIAHGRSSNILIYDWDLHHGNGTQNSIIENSVSNIFFVSTHFYSRGFYPGTGGDYLFDPNNFNLEQISNVYNFPSKKLETKNFSQYFESEIVPLLNVLCEKVDTIIISNGLDAHIEDPFAKLCFTDDDYVYMTNYFKSKNKKIIFLLEGGYKPEIIARVSLKLINLFD